jgi:hypothetical protein
VAKPKGKQLLRSSLHLLRQDPKVVWLPLISITAAIVSFIVVTLVVLAILVVSLGNPPASIFFIALFAGYYVATATSVYFNLALVYAATDRIEGRAPTIRGSLSKARQRKTVILRWAFLAAVALVVVGVIEKFLGRTGGMIVGFVGVVAWGAATMFILPVLAFEDIGPIKSVERSSHLFKARFGTVARTSVRFGVLFMGWMLLATAAVVVGVVLIFRAPALGITLVALGIFGVFALAQVSAAAGVYVRTVLYRYATDQSVPDLGLDLSQTFAREPR